jgi:hypothetical protein
LSGPPPVPDFPDDPAPAGQPALSRPPAGGAGAAAPLPAAGARAAAPSPRDQFEAAARLEASQPARAIELYRQVAASGSAWAPNALYALARLDADRGDAAEARRLLQEYLLRYPRGANAQDARELLDRLR